MRIQIKIHRLIISSFSPIDNLTIKEVTKTSIATKESTEFYQVCNDNIKKYFEKTVALHNNVECHHDGHETFFISTFASSLETFS